MYSLIPNSFSYSASGQWILTVEPTGTGPFSKLSWVSPKANIVLKSSLMHDNRSRKNVDICMIKSIFFGVF